ncbi:MAG: phosphoenolpyruvate--protein phosphotransferase [Verrucomicrobiaceae bacterium]|nr:phosphoenolpyruvate--protein phosphotransferase [Verrucomicrobiaceae bacterium]
MSEIVQNDQPAEERRFSGLAASPGIGIGKAFVHGGVTAEPEAYRVEQGDVEGEIARLEVALVETRKQIEQLQEQVGRTANGHREASIFDAHLLMLEDRSVLDEVISIVRGERVNIDSACYRTINNYIAVLRVSDDVYLKQRVVDFEDVMRRILRNLSLRHPADQRVRHPHVLIAHELTPSDTAAMDRSLVMGFATEVGGSTAHTAIIARSLGLPAVLGLRGICDAIHTGDSLLIDGYDGILIINPSPETLTVYDALADEKNSAAKRLEDIRDSKPETSDGREITLSANIEFEHEVSIAKENGAQGIGLYRTEFFYMHDGDMPSEDHQAENYSRVVSGIEPDGVIIRTVDIGGDKLPAGVSEPEANPFLGWRGVRLTLARVEMFKAQLRAILRAGAAGNVSVMFPMLSTLDEMKRCRLLLEECADELVREGVEHSREIDVGAMIEVPSAALISDQIAGEVDFLSVGTNDLIQYTMAVDRDNDQVASLYQPLNPAVIRLLRMTVSAGHEKKIWVGVCGEMASDLLCIPLLVGLGFDEFSVSAPRVPSVKHALRSLSYDECKAMATEALKYSGQEDILASCRALAMESYPELLSR